MSAIGEVSLITNCAPATGSFVAPGSSTTTSSDTVSPGSASFVPICHAIAPSGTVTGVDVVVSDSVVVSVDSGVVLSVSVTVVLVVVSTSVVVVVSTSVVVVVVSTSVVVVVSTSVVVVVSTSVVVVVVSTSVVVVVVSSVVVDVVVGTLTLIPPLRKRTFLVMLPPFVSDTYAKPSPANSTG